MSEVPPSPGVPAFAWLLFLIDCQRLLSGELAVRTAALGWSDRDLFAFDPTAWHRPERQGLLWRVNGGRMAEIYRDHAVVTIRGQPKTICQRRPGAEGRLPWDHDKM